jgi:membrane protease YdiL (CAAX protease family)
MGLLFGVLRRRTGSLYPGMLVHAGWNTTIIWAELAARRFP